MAKAKAKRLYCVVLGGGGHAHVVVDTLQLMGRVIPDAVLDSDRSRWGKSLLGIPILGDDKLLPELKNKGIRYFVVGLGSIGDNGPRQRLFELALSHGLEPLTIIHPSAVCSPWVKLGPGVQLLPRSVVNVGAIVGSNVIINSGAIVEHHCVLGDHVHVATGAQLASTVSVGTGAHIGAGATVRQCITIGEWAVVGAGAVVVKDVPPHTVVTGVPAFPLQKKQGKNVCSKPNEVKTERPNYSKARY